MDKGKGMDIAEQKKRRRH